MSALKEESLGSEWLVGGAMGVSALPEELRGVSALKEESLGSECIEGGVFRE